MTWSAAGASGQNVFSIPGAQVVVGVEVRQEDVLEVDEPDRRAQELALGSLAAVEQQPVASPAEE